MSRVTPKVNWLNPLEHPRTALFGLLTISGAVLTAWFAVEEVLLTANRRPITWYTRRLVNKHWLIALVLSWVFAFVAGVAETHFVLDSDQQPKSGR